MIGLYRSTVRIKILEWVCIAALFSVGFHCISERIAHRSLPSGDEGSWLSAAAQLSRGQGFSSRWLEYQFQKPYCLPRPDDFRFPGLVLLLAAVFKAAGISYCVALKTCAAVFLCFCAALFACVRKTYGRATALLTLAATVCSLNQLQWNSIVYCEGLFGLILALVLIMSITADPRSKDWWIAVGAAVGVLAMVRPNGMLLSAGLIGQYAWMRRSGPVPGRFLAYSLFAASAVAAPWLIRNALWFGNPFHIAGGAGLLQRSFGESANESVIAFVKTAEPIFLLKATLLGIPRFFHTLIEFEHGLCIPLLIFCAVGCILRMRFFNAFTATGFTVSFVACCYAAYKSYAGVRYFTPFLPFVYAYGIHAATSLLRQAPFIRRSNYPTCALYAAVCISFTAPVYYPHRYYERYFASHEASAIDYSSHVRVLDEISRNNGTYFAGRLAQLNFLTQHNCVGIQEDFDSAQVYRAVTVFKPTMLALAPEEQNHRRFITFIDLLRRNQCIETPKATTSFGVYYALEYPAGRCITR